VIVYAEGMNKIIEHLNRSNNLRNFTILSETEVSLPSLGINIQRDTEADGFGDQYIVTEYGRDTETGEYDVFAQHNLSGGRGHVFDWLDRLDESMDY